MLDYHIPPHHSETEAAGAKLAAEVSDPEAALRRLLGPELEGGAAKPLSEQVGGYLVHVWVRLCGAVLSHICRRVGNGHGPLTLTKWLSVQVGAGPVFVK